MRKELGTFGLLVVLCIIVTILNPRFLSATNLQNMAALIGMYSIFSLGVGIVIITGGIDLSVGSVFALLGVLLSIFMDQFTLWHLPGALVSLLAILAVIAITTGLGVFHGFLITKMRMQPFIVTLCGLLFYRGMARFIADDATKGFGNVPGFETLRGWTVGSQHFPIPMQFILMIIIAAVLWVILHRSVYGRYLFAVGRNEEAARYSGINSSLVVASAYALCGLLAGIAGVLFAFDTPSISPSSHGNSYELYGIAAAVLGGCSLRGGEGSVIGIIIGAALLQVLRNLINLLGIASALEYAVIGAVILLGVMADQFLQRRSVKVKA